MAKDRLRTPNIRDIFSIWKRIVRDDTFYRGAISLPESSSEANSSICCWRGVALENPWTFPRAARLNRGGAIGATTRDP